MAQALPRVTAQASTLGVSIDELMASFATLTNVSGNTAEVSTQLAAIFTALIKPSSEATEMAQQMGIQFDAAAIKAAGGMQQFLESLSAEKIYNDKTHNDENEKYSYRSIMTDDYDRYSEELGIKALRQELRRVKVGLAPLNSPRKGARPVSYYALFE